MVQSLQLGTSSQADEQNGMRRLNRLPIIIAIIVVVVFIGVVVIGLSLRGLSFNRGNFDDASNSPATSFGDQLKRGISDGIIGEPDKQEVFQPAPVEMEKSEKQQPIVERQSVEREESGQSLEPEEVWKARLKREQDEQYMREAQRQRMARIQARATALDSPLKVDVSDIDSTVNTKSDTGRQPATSAANRTSDLYAAALQSGLMGQNADQNGQASKEDFFNQDIKDLGYLPNQVVPQMSPNELKRGSVIPATLITGLNSDLPGRITAQVSQNVYDSATGHRLLIPQGAKLFGRYDSKVSFGQERVLVVWTDLIFPNGSTLQIGGMAGTDAEGYGGFRDKVDRRLWRTFGSAALVALIGTGIDMSMPQSSTLAT
ncbi:Type IV secretion system protein virB10 [Agrobacterium sp. DSM 25558]|nr:Type IV secretion system protein virB10 [Agrobacterium sp. DSM 25558]